ncbi:hypothetical protein NEIRO03_0201 [Nematocida sp. AWRm78]|nr:hypothetical protein NEIRO02_0202 [Nematocida sp. AWRm79]KAI5182537.1 hypothetical protein NEIRO03_0201 [Nematocida sp. AWRm78]
MNQTTLQAQGTMNEGAGQTCTITIEQETTQTGQGLSNSQIDSVPDEHITLLKNVKKLTEEELEARREANRRKKRSNDCFLALIKIAAGVSLFSLFILSMYALAEHKTN